jgi:hypothetical protein
LVVAGLWSWFTQPKVPKFDPLAQANRVESRLSKWTPADAWTWWIEYYRPLAERGFPVFETADKPRIEQQIAHRQSLRGICWTAAAVVGAVTAAIAFWPEPRQRR